MLPNCIIAGVQKSATTWLQVQLQEHPDIFIPRGEIHFFDRDRNYSQGISWYERHFQNSGNKRIIADKTPGYFWTTCEAVPNEPLNKPERMYDLLPNAKILIIFRDPVKRAISALHHNIRSGEISSKISVSNIFDKKFSGLVEKHGILTRGLYHQQLMRLLEFFPREQVLLNFQEHIFMDPISGLNRVFDFLGVESYHDPDLINRRENSRSPSQLATSLCHYGHHYLPAAAKELTRIVHAIDKRVPENWQFKRLEYPEASNDVLQRLRAFYREDVNKLSAEFGPVPESWIET